MTVAWDPSALTDLGPLQAYTSSRLNKRNRNFKWLKGRLMFQFPAQMLISPTSGSLNTGGPIPDSSVTWISLYVQRFVSTGVRAADGMFECPDGFVGMDALNVELTWKTTLTTGSVRWKVTIYAVADDAALDTAPTGQSAEVTSAAPDTAGKRQTVSVSIASPGLAAGDLVVVRITRDTTHAADDLAGDALLAFVKGEVG